MKTFIFLCCSALAALGHAQAVNSGAAAVSTHTPVNLAWDHTPNELYVDGGKKFKYEGRHYVLKLGFKRGAYEAFVKNYKSIPVFILTDVTGGPENFMVWNAGLAESDNPFRINAYGGIQLTVLLRQSEVIVARHMNKDDPGKKAASFPFKELKDLWAENARKYKAAYNGGTAYFVPQAFYNQSGCNSVGYVVSMPEPYFADTGLPLDFVEMYRYTKASTDKRRVTYSIPMGMVFTRSAEDGKTWAVKEIERSALYDALDDEADNPDECNMALRKAMEKAAAEK